MILNRKHKKGELGKWLTNIYDPGRSDSRAYHVSSSLPKEESDRKWNDHVDYLEKHILGPPKASKRYTVEQLQKMHIVGVYAYPE